MIPDCDLLRQFADEGKEAAFAEVVCRHADLVYSAALRLTNGNSALAQDVSQQVFIDLANKAARLTGHPTLAGWLHRATRYHSYNLIRTEQRRQTREQESITMHENSPAIEPDWSQLSPLLDEAIGQLKQADAEAVLLRFFQGKSHREVGEVLGLGEDSARKRIERALEKLRKHFARKEVKISSVLLAGAMANNSVQAAPASFSAKWSAFALANHGTPSVGSDSLMEKTPWMPRRVRIVILALAGMFVFGGLAIELELAKSPSPGYLTLANQALGGAKTVNGAAVELPKTGPAKAGGEAGEETVSAAERARLKRIATVQDMYYPISGATIRQLLGSDIGDDVDAKLTNFFIQQGFKFPQGVTVKYDRAINELYVSGGTPGDTRELDDKFEKYTDPVGYLTRDGTVLFLYYSPDAAHPKTMSFPPANVTYVDEQGRTVAFPPLPRLLNDPVDSTEPIGAVRILSDINDSLAQGTVTVRIHTDVDVEELSDELDAARAKK